jgi:hypothetical protein
MRILAIILNIVLLVVSGFLVADEMSHPDGKDYLLAALFLGTPVVTLICLFLRRENSKGWLALFLQRKALEERRKIEDLNKKDAA